jgi:GT2 family glycosyltransferase
LARVIKQLRNKRLNKVVILILNYNKVNDLIECLESICRLDYSPFDVVVCDNGSTDGSPVEVQKKFQNVHVIRLPENLGIVKARIVETEFVKHNFIFDFVLFLDNDTVLRSDFLDELIRGFSIEKDTGITCGKTYTNFNTKIIMSAGVAVNLFTGLIGDRGYGQLDDGQYDSVSEVDACGGFGFLISREALLSAGEFDKRYNFYGWEDIDFSFRVKKNGYKILFIPSAVMCHKGTKLGRGPKPEYERSKVKNYFLFLRIHANLIQRFTCFFIIPFRALFLSLKLIREGHTHIIFQQIGGLFDLIKKRKRPNLIKG